MRRRPTFAVGLALLVLVGAYVTAARRTDGPPLDPASTAPDGARAVVELLDRVGGRAVVVDGVPEPAVDTALVLQDRSDRDRSEGIDGWVRAGGTLVVADPASPLVPRVVGAVTGEVPVTCDVPALAAVTSLDLGEVGLALDTPPGAGTCRTPGGDAVVVVTTRGAGAVVAVGGPFPFTNEGLRAADDAVLAAALLAPTPGSDAAFLRAVAPGGGDAGLVDLVGTPVRAALAQLAVAFGVVVLWRARRLGRPVVETQPVEVDGSELVAAVGRLLQGNRRPDRAAAALRDRARRDLSAPLGLDLDPEVATVVAVVAARTSLTEAEARRAVADPVRSDDDLVAVADLLARLREETTRGT